MEASMWHAMLYKNFLLKRKSIALYACFTLQIVGVALVYSFLSHNPAPRYDDAIYHNAPVLKPSYRPSVQDDVSRILRGCREPSVQNYQVKIGVHPANLKERFQDFLSTYTNFANDIIVVGEDDIGSLESSILKGIEARNNLGYNGEFLCMGLSFDEESFESENPKFQLFQLSNQPEVHHRFFMNFIFYETERRHEYTNLSLQNIASAFIYDQKLKQEDSTLVTAISEPNAKIFLGNSLSVFPEIINGIFLTIKNPTKCLEDIARHCGNVPEILEYFREQNYEMISPIIQEVLHQVINDSSPGVMKALDSVEYSKEAMDDDYDDDKTPLDSEADTLITDVMEYMRKLSEGVCVYDEDALDSFLNGYKDYEIVSQWLMVSGFLKDVFFNLNPEFRALLLSSMKQSIKDNDLDWVTPITSTFIKKLITQGQVSSVMMPNMKPLQADNARIALFDVNVILLMILCLIKALLVDDLNQESQEHIPAVLRSFGVSRLMYYGSWFITYLVLDLVLVLVSTGLLNTMYFSYSNYFLIFITLLVYTSYLTVLAFLLTSIFKNSATCHLVLIALLAVGCWVGLSTRMQSSVGSRAVMYFLPSFGPLRVLRAAYSNEFRNYGLQWDNFGEGHDGFQLGAMIIATFLCCLICLAVQYIITIFEDGTSFFDLFPSFRWAKGNYISLHEEYNTVRQSEVVWGKAIEEGVSIRGLGRGYYAYNGSFLPVLKNINIDFQVGDISVLLGRNGAGKSTLFSSLLGLTTAQIGQIKFDGVDISKSSDVLKQVGFSPQYDSIWRNLTVSEHLKIYLRLKGCKGKEMYAEALKLMKLVNLKSKMDCKANTLSGGMKRKLCFILAFVGDSKYIFLDEPTTGVDPISRHDMWCVIEALRPGRTMIISTHFMDEAERLADKIAVIEDGYLRCEGSILFAKKHYRCGYDIALDKGPAYDSLVGDFKEELRMICPSCVLIDQSEIRATITVPESSTRAMPHLLDSIKRQRKELFARFYFSYASLEKVFNEDPEQSNSNNETYMVPTLLHNREELQQTGKHAKNRTSMKVVEYVKRELNISIALIYRHWKILLKNWPILLLRIFLPLVVITIMQLGNVLSSTTARTPLGENYRLKFCGVDRKAPLTVGYLDNTTVTDPFNNTDLPTFYSNVATVDLSISEFEGSEFKFGRYQDKALVEITEPEISEHAKLPQEDLPRLLRFFKILRQEEKRPESYWAPQIGGLIFRQKSIISSGVLSLNPASYAIFNDGNGFSGYYILNELWSKFYNDRGMDVTYDITVNDLSNQSNRLDAWTALYGCVCINLVAIYIISFLSKERDSGIKHMLRLYGAGPLNYLISAAIVDVTIGLTSAVLALYLGVEMGNVEGKDPYRLGEYTTHSMMLWFTVAVVAEAYLIFNIISKTRMSTMWLIVYSSVTMCLGIFASSLHVNKTMRNRLGFFAELLIVLMYFFPSSTIGFFLVAMTQKHLFEDGNARGAVNLCGQVVPIQFLVFLLLAILIEYVPYMGIPPGLLSFKKKTFIRKMQKDCSGNDAQMQAMGAGVDTEVTNSSGIRDCQVSRCLVVSNAWKVFNGHFWLIRLWRKVFFRKSATNDETKKAVADVQSDSGNVVALKNLSAKLPPNAVVLLLGLNGAGKTSLIKAVVDEDRLDSGKISFHGLDSVKQTRRYRKTIGWCPQQNCYWEDLTVEEHLVLLGYLACGDYSLSKNKAVELMESMGLMKYQKYNISRLSRGTRRKLNYLMGAGVGRSLMMLDEPAAGLDPPSRVRLIEDSVHRVSGNEGKSVMISTHTISEAEGKIDHAIVMYQGELLFSGTLLELKNRYKDRYTVKFSFLSYDENTIDHGMNILKNCGIGESVTEKQFMSVYYNLEGSHITNLAFYAQECSPFAYTQEGTALATIGVLKWYLSLIDGLTMKNVLQAKLGSYKEINFSLRAAVCSVQFQTDDAAKIFKGLNDPVLASEVKAVDWDYVVEAISLEEVIKYVHEENNAIYDKLETELH